MMSGGPAERDRYPTMGGVRRWGPPRQWSRRHASARCSPGPAPWPPSSAGAARWPRRPCCVALTAPLKPPAPVMAGV